jgi:hypothetical protein
MKPLPLGPTLLFGGALILAWHFAGLKVKDTWFVPLLGMGLTLLAFGVVVLAWFLGGFWALVGTAAVIVLAMYLYARPSAS